MAALGGITLKVSLTVSEGVSPAPKKASGDREVLPPLFEKTDISLDKEKKGELSSCKLSSHLRQV